MEFINRHDIATAEESVLGFLRRPSSYDLFTYDRIVFFLLLGFAAIVIFESILNRNRPVSVLATKLSVTFHDDTGRHMEVYRTQYLRANRPGVNAYFMEAWTGFGGTVPRTRVATDAFVGTMQISNRADMPPKPGNQHLEINHVFDNGLPFQIWNMIIPEFLVRALLIQFGWELPFVVRRTVELHYLDEHTLGETDYQVAADRYTQRNLNIELKFNPGRLPALSGNALKYQLIKRAGVQDMYARNIGSHTHELTIPRLHNEKVRIPFKWQ